MPTTPTGAVARPERSDLAKKTDAVTRWWRGTSLRAKVTGVTVAVLAIGLIATGIGSVVFLRNALIANLDATLRQIALTDVATGLFDVVVADGEAFFASRADAPRTDYFVAIYAPDGEFVISGGGIGPAPDFPDEFTLSATVIRGQEPFALEGAETATDFHGSVATITISRTRDFYTQMVVLPLTPVERVVSTYLGIFSILAVVAIFAGALLTRWLVTLTFRGLGQVETTAMEIASGDLSQRLTDIEPGTEVGRLKMAINTMLGHVDGAIAQRDATVQQMRRFIGDASHELRTPLVTVRGYAELYRMGAISGQTDIAQSMERIEKEAIRMGVLVEDLLALARLDEQRDVAIAPVDLRPIARDAAMDVRAASPGRVVTVVDTTVTDPGDDPAPAGEDEHVDEAPRKRGHAAPTPRALADATRSLLRRKPKPVPAAQASTAAPEIPAIAPLDITPDANEDHPRTAPIVLGDENRIRQVITNLLGNARRFAPDDSPIDLTVGVDRAAGMGWIAIADHGEGIPEQVREKIFQRFWRADTSRARETGGSGLGLSIVASIVKAHHGAIAVTETPGGGATFRVSLPLAHGQDAADALDLATRPMPRAALPESADDEA